MSKQHINLVAQSVISFAVGAFIYLAFRTETLLVFTWMRNLGLEYAVSSMRNHLDPLLPVLPTWIKYSFPDGLWVYGSTMLFGAIWLDEAPAEYSPWFFVPIVFAISAEFMQLLRLIEGTFCFGDLLAYFSAFILAIISINELKKEVCYACS